MKRVGITGQNGFVGSHLYNTLGLFPDDFEEQINRQITDPAVFRKYTNNINIYVSKPSTPLQEMDGRMLKGVKETT